MNLQDVFSLLEENKDEKGIKNWNKLKVNHWNSFGIGLTKLKKLAKEIGKNDELAKELFISNNYDAKILSALIDLPKKVTRKQLENQIKEMDFWMLSHIFTSNLYGKLKYAPDLLDEWLEDENDTKRRISYLLTYQLAKKLSEDKSLEIINTIEKRIKTEANFVKDAMLSALFALGQKNKMLNNKCLDVMKNVGKIEVDYGMNSCEPIDVVKHLNSDRIQKKFK